MFRASLVFVIAIAVVVIDMGPATVTAQEAPSVQRLTFDSATEVPVVVRSIDINGDGTLIVFQADRPISPEDNNGASDIYMLDRTTGQFSLISANSSGQAANGASAFPRISADGSTIVWRSSATDLADNDTNGQDDIFAYDTTTQAVTLVSRAESGDSATGFSQSSSVSGDGTLIAYASNAPDITAESNNFYHVYLYNTATDTTTMVSVNTVGAAANNESLAPEISNSGGHVAFQSRATDLVTGATDTPTTTDVFIRDLATETTELVSVDLDGDAAESAGNPSLSADGSLVVYQSDADDLVAGDTNGETDAFLYARGSGVTTMASAANGDYTGDGEVSGPRISADGAIVVFAADIVQTNSGGIRSPQVFLHDLSDDSTTLISATGGGATGDSSSFFPMASLDGASIAFISLATNLDEPSPSDPPNSADLFVFGPEIEVIPPDTFVDDDDSIFEPDIEWLAAEGITQGCNPPTNDRFCPNDPVTRGQMAAFLVRALDLTDDGGGNSFIDDDGSVFELNIAKLAAAGITRGCNPPTNDRFCPNDPVTRGQMAAFLSRSLGGS